jgi:3'-phosphoadenosine 5'-phosphosulfate (PAPS) 3'-phosphatase
VCFHFFKQVNSIFSEVSKGNFDPKVNIKGKGEKFTDADWIIQKVFENYMNTYFKNIQIIGEEDTSVEIVKESRYFTNLNDENILEDVVGKNDIPEEFETLNLDELKIFIDPIDATGQFIKRNFEPVTCLIGVTCKGEPLLGFIHFPFYLGKSPATFFNIPTKGVYCYDYEKGNYSLVPNMINDKNSFILGKGCYSRKTVKKCI